MNARLKTFLITAVCFVLAIAIIGSNIQAQNRVAFGGIRNAWDFAYGINPNVPALVGLTAVAAGTNSYTVAVGAVSLPDGTVIAPLATNAPVTILDGSNTETVTPTAVTCTTPDVYGSCSFTAVFGNAHGQGNRISSATFGLQEAANAAHVLGGLVIIDGKWKQAGGQASTLTGNTGWTNVSILDGRGTVTGSAFSYKAASNGAAWAASAISWY